MVGVVEPRTVAANNTNRRLQRVISSTGYTESNYLDSRLGDSLFRDTVTRFVLKYGVDGFKQDDVYQTIGNDQPLQASYGAQFLDIFATAKALKSDFTINTCSCGVAQNFYLFAGQNQLIISDPSGPRQIRLRAKYLKVLDTIAVICIESSYHVSLGPGRKEYTHSK